MLTSPNRQARSRRDTPIPLAGAALVNVKFCEVAMIHFVCPRCRSGCAVEEEEGGKKTTCRSCGKTMVARRRAGAAPHHVPRGGGERPKQAGKGRSSVALRRMAAIQTLWRVGLQVVGTTPGQVMTGYFF